MASYGQKKIYDLRCNFSLKIICEKQIKLNFWTKKFKSFLIHFFSTQLDLFNIIYKNHTKWSRAKKSFRAKLSHHAKVTLRAKLTLRAKVSLRAKLTIRSKVSHRAKVSLRAILTHSRLNCTTSYFKTNVNFLQIR